MKKLPLKRFTAWSLSRWQDYMQCPAHASYKHLHKLFEEKTAAKGRGIDVHEAAEMYVAGRVKKFTQEIHPKALKVLNELRAEYKKRRVRVELELAFDRAWKPVEWYAREAWLRVKLDVLRMLPKYANLLDYKTGKERDHGEYDNQLHLYGLTGLVAGYAKETRGSILFTDTGRILERPEGILTLGDLPKAKEYWEDTVAPMFADTRFAPRPGNYCRWCRYSCNKGGPCRY